MQADSLINVNDVIVKRAELETAPVVASVAVAEVEAEEEKKPAKKAKK